MRTPDAWPSTAHTSVAVGTPTSLSVVKSVPTFDDCMSTTGEAPVTVTDSCSDATCSWPSMVRIWPRPRMTPARLKVWNPDSSNVSSYGPEGSEAIEYLPSAFGHGRAHAHQRRGFRRDGDAGQHPALCVGDRPVQTALVDLRHRRRRDGTTCRKQYITA